MGAGPRQATAQGGGTFKLQNRTTGRGGGVLRRASAATNRDISSAWRPAGHRIPDFCPRTGFTVRTVPGGTPHPVFTRQTGTYRPKRAERDTASQFPAPNWDTLSQTSRWGRCIPFSGSKPGFSVPDKPSGTTYPGMRPWNGTQRPHRTPRDTASRFARQAAACHGPWPHGPSRYISHPPSWYISHPA